MSYADMPVPYELGVMVGPPEADDFVLLKSSLSQFSFDALAPDQNALDSHEETVRAAHLLEGDALFIYTPQA